MPEFVIISNLSRPEKREARYTLFLFLRYTHSLVLHYLSWKPIAAPPGSADPSHLAIRMPMPGCGSLQTIPGESGVRVDRAPTDGLYTHGSESSQGGRAAMRAAHDMRINAARHTTPCRMRHTPESVPFPNHRNGVTPLDPPVDGIPARPLWKALVSGLDTLPATGKLRPLCPPL